jgi:hypothetical protein
MGIFFVYFQSTKKNRKFSEDHPTIIPTKFGANWHSGFREEDLNIKVYRRRMQRDGNTSPYP